MRDDVRLRSAEGRIAKDFLQDGQGGVGRGGSGHEAVRHECGGPQSCHVRAYSSSLGAPAALIDLAARSIAHTYSVGSTKSVSRVAETRPPMTTTASGFCVSAPMAVDKAMGRRPNMASRAVIRTVRRRLSEPCSAAIRGGMPEATSWLKWLTMTTPFSTAWPNRAIKPIAADTDSGMSVMNSATMPPIRAKGMLTMISVALRSELKALTSSRKISRMDSGTTQERRCMARTWFSNSPDQLMR